SKMRLKNTSQWMIIMIAFFIFSCQSQDDTLIEKDISVSEVQSLYQHLNTTQSNGRQTSDLEILWDEARYKDVSTGDALVFPIKSSVRKYIRQDGTSTAYPIEQQAQAFAYRSDDGSLLLDYVQMIPTSQADLFTGYVSVSDWNGDPKHLFKYENGEYVGNQSNGRSEDLYCYWIDTETCTVVTSGGIDYEDCEISSTLHCHTIDTPPTIAPGGFSDPGGGGSPGDGSIELCPHPTIIGEFVPCEDDIITDLKNTCLKQVALNLVNQDFGNNINTAINDIFNGNGLAANLIIRENNFRNRLASTAPAYIDSQGNLHITIFLNPNLIYNASQEYIAAALYHEAIHAYLLFNLFSHNQLKQHYEIAKNYLDWIQEALLEAYPNLSSKDAKGLSVRFLADVNRDNPDYFDELVKDLGFNSLQELIDATDQYRDGVSGQACP
ncbi:MAG: hypothetical protein AAFQ94_24165, partial [Bacteroidota bacterium]